MLKPKGAFVRKERKHIMNRKTVPIVISLIVAVLCLSGEPDAWATPTAAWVTNLIPIAVTDGDYAGEVVQITMSVSTVSGCPQNDFYAVRDTNIIRGALALATAALVSGRQLDLFVSGSCDSNGRPLVTNVTMH
jgi:hypothetical protein